MVFMSQNELDAILNEIRTKGKASDEDKSFYDDKETSINDMLDSFNSAMNREKETPAEPAIEAFEPAIIEDERPPRKKNNKKKKNNSKKPIIIAIAVLIIIAIIASVCAIAARNGKDDTEPTTQPTTEAATEEAPQPQTFNAVNPLTGEAGYSDSAIGKRPVAVVVENEYSSSGVRPQWGIDKADIILEGESESSTRTLLFWADYSSMPEKIGPTRSARPPFIRFSQLFDSIFIHAGLSKSKGSYVGADSVFANEGVDHINLLSFPENSGYFGRDKSRTSTVEHTGYLNGTNAPRMIEESGINTAVNDAKFTSFSFNEEPADIGNENGSECHFVWSDRCPDSIDVYYRSNEDKYYSDHFDSSSSGEVSNCRWTNVIFLLDQTEYIVKENYKHAGNSETYCDYKLAGGDGIVLSHGSAVRIKWGVADGKLWMKNASTDEDIKLNVGNTYIGYGSANHGGAMSLTE